MTSHRDLLYCSNQSSPSDKRSGTTSAGGRLGVRFKGSYTNFLQMNCFGTTPFLRQSISSVPVTSDAKRQYAQAYSSSPTAAESEVMSRLFFFISLYHAFRPTVFDIRILQANRLSYILYHNPIKKSIAGIDFGKIQSDGSSLNDSAAAQIALTN